MARKREACASAINFAKATLIEKSYVDTRTAEQGLTGIMKNIT